MDQDGSTEPDAGAVAARRRWLAVLAKASADELEDAWHALSQKPPYRLLRRSEVGLAMVRARIGGAGQPFNVGEMTMTRAAVQLLDDNGEAIWTGFGYVAGRAERKAELVALFDALLQDSERHDGLAANLIEPLTERQRAAKAKEAGKVQASKVEFFTMVRGE